MPPKLPEHLNRLLRAANVDPANAEARLQERANAQMNAYVGLLNARLERPPDAAPGRAQLFREFFDHMDTLALADT
jgi:hypothetical protein